MSDADIVTVNLTLAPTPKDWFPNFIVLLNPIRAQIEMIIEAQPKLFIFPFYNGKPEAVPDFSDCEMNPRYAHLAQPFYIGNLDRPWDAAMQYIDHHVRPRA
jgi:hypothetical protein